MNWNKLISTECCLSVRGSMRIWYTPALVLRNYRDEWHYCSSHTEEEYFEAVYRNWLCVPVRAAQTPFGTLPS